MTITEATLTEITRRLVATYQPEQVVLFGSHAWGEPDESSDVDLLVVVSESAEPAYRRASAGYRSLFGLGVPCDVWVRTREEVLREAPLSTTLTHKIIREGRVLHGTRDLDENTLLDLDAQGQVLAITLEHATARAELSSFSLDRVAA